MLSDREDDFRKLLDTHAGAMYRQALRILGNREDAEDAVQDALLRIWKHRRTYGNRSSISTWIFRITYNASRAVKERRDRSGFWAQFLDHESPPRATPELEVQAEPQSPVGEDMARLLSLLPPVQAAALSLFYVEELEYKEIARVLKIPPGSVATAIHRGKQRLRAILMRHDGGPHGKL
jgi:RNA polymerase sigma-70 factor (ECF subfamily)